MRRFVDREGRAWDVLAGRASWGVTCALFIATGHEAQVRQATMMPESVEAAQRELDDLDESALAALLESSTPQTLE